MLKHTDNWWGFIGGKVEYVQNESGERQYLHPSIMKQVIITDELDTTLFHIIESTSLEETTLDIGAHVMMVEVQFPGQMHTMVAQLSIASVSEPLKPLEWLSEDVFKAVISKHNENRRNELSEFGIEFHYDFITVYHHGDISTSLKTQGRAAFSIDKGPRALRSATLKDDDEVLCIGTVIIVLYTCNADGSYEKWSINRIVNEIFKKTKAYSVLSKSRKNNNVAVTNQLRRWLPFCKDIARKTNFFNDDECPVFTADPQNTDLRIKWMNKHAPKIFDFVKEWLKSGEKNSEILEPEVSGHTQITTMKEWYEQRLKDIIIETSSPVVQTQTSSIVAGSFAEDDKLQNNLNATLQVVDEVRIQMLTNMFEKGKDDKHKKKMQNHFQVC